MRWPGLLLIALTVLIPIPMLASLGLNDPSALASQWLGMSAIILMAWALIVAARVRVLQTLFGGLDQMYRLHKWLAIAALAAITLHDNIDAEIRGITNALGLGSLGEDLGEQSYNVLIALILVSVLTFIPHRWWKWTHKLIGAAFVLGVAHVVLVDKAFPNASPLGLYIIAFGALGTLSYIATLLPARLWFMPHRYQIIAIEPTGDAVSITMAPASPRERLAYKPGSFVFVRSAAAHREPHPFTISSAPNEDGLVRITTKPLGDGTRALCGNASVGAAVELSPAHGRFHLKTKRPQLWIAGGVGITPFAAWAAALPADAPPVHLIHCVRRAADAPLADEIAALADAKPNLTVTMVDSSCEARLTAAHAASLSPAPLAEIDVAACGPEPLLDDLYAGLRARGLPRGRWHAEAFRIRTGIGGGTIARRLWDAFGRRWRLAR